jgi:hypothetical protein
LIGLPELAAIGVVALVAWLVWDALRSREHANDAMRRACEMRHFFFLDDTVSLHSLRPFRDDEGRVRLRRVYHFQFSDTGHNRRNGSIALVRDRVVALDLGDTTGNVVPPH